jgi:hypothetical protein
MPRTVKLLRQQQKWIHITLAAYGRNKYFHMSVFFLQTGLLYQYIVYYIRCKKSNQRYLIFL